MTSPANGAQVLDSTPEFRFSYSDVITEGDAQQAFQIQIARDSTFNTNTIAYDSGRVVSNTTSFTLPEARKLAGQTDYWWRVRVADIYSGSAWGAWSGASRFRNIVAPGIALRSGSTTLASGASYAFADVDRGAIGTASFQIANEGSENLQVNAITVAPAAPFFVTAPTAFPVVVQPGQTATLSMNFSPPATGLHAATLTLLSNDPVEPGYTLSLSGRSVDRAFRYKEYLYSRSGAFIYGKLNNMAQYWGDGERIQGQARIAEFITFLKGSPSNSGRRWALLDVVYDVALAELILAQEQSVGANQISLGLTPPPPGVSRIQQEIAALEQACQQYRRGLTPYFSLLQNSMGLNTQSIDAGAPANMPFGYYIFQKEVPTRSLASPLRRNAQGDWLLPGEAGSGYSAFQLYAGYKDLVLLLQIQQEYVRAASRLVQLYLLQFASEGGATQPPVAATSLVNQVLQSSYAEVQLLLSVFGINVDQGNWNNLPARLRQVILAWRTDLTSFTRYRDHLQGRVNPLGFVDEMLVRSQSQIPGDLSSQYFNSYDFLKAYMVGAASGPLTLAMADLNAAKTSYQNYRDRQDQLAAQLQGNRNTYDERLRQITGVRFGEPGYDNPNGNPGSEIALLKLGVGRAELRLAIAQSEITRKQGEIEIVISRRGQALRINDALRQVFIDYGNQNASLIEEIGAIQANISGMSNYQSPFQSSIEQNELLKSLKTAELQRLAAKEKSTIASLDAQVIDLNSAAEIKNLMLQMQSLFLNAIDADIEIKAAGIKLEALLGEKAELERRRNEADQVLADSYFADPAHRLLKDQSILRAELGFQSAQEWLYLTLRALRYKWNQPFQHNFGGYLYTEATLFQLCNAGEVKDMFDAMADFDARMVIGQRNDDGYKKFSLREDFLGFGRNGSATIHQLGLFRQHLRNNILQANDKQNPLGMKAIRVSFSTVRERTLFFRQTRWLEKIKFLRLKAFNGSSGRESLVDAYLEYGGTSYIRNRQPGVPSPANSDQVLGEMTAYPVRYIYWDGFLGRWQYRDRIASSVPVQVSNDPSVPDSAYTIDTFQELSVAASDWTLYIAIEDFDGLPLLDLSKITDIEIHFYYYGYSRN